jgi:hypothetical protein
MRVTLKITEVESGGVGATTQYVKMQMQLPSASSSSGALVVAGGAGVMET